MARGIVVELAGKTTRFDLQVVTRAKLYGSRKKVVVDEDGEPTQSGWLVHNGATLLGPGGRAELYLDAHGDIVEREDLAAVDAEGKLLERLPSTLDTPQPAALVGPEVLLEYVATNVYALSPDAAELDPDLIAQLEAGQILQTSFSYNPGFARAPLFILKNNDDFFAIPAEPAPLELLSREVLVTLPDPPDAPVLDGDQDLDFDNLG